MRHALEHRNLVSWVYYTYPFNLTGQPAASLPVGLSSRGTPVGLQIVTPRNDEEGALKIAAWLERALALRLDVQSAAVSSE
jgi:aspartyl-tRNA(Asn)/glutamyl-tRNA(Gln) amidotransferase subunit A